MGFAEHDGVLEAPASAAVTLASVGQFFELRISLESGTAIVAVLAKAALKIRREPSACDDPGADMLDDHAMRGAHDDEEPDPP